MENIKILEYTPEYKEECIKLLKETFPNASNEQTFKWRYESYKKLDPLIIIAVDNKKVVSFVSWMPWEFTFEGRELIGYQACEGATNPTYRNKGLFTKMFLYSEKIAKDRGIGFYFGFPSRMSYGPVYRAGYIPVVKFNLLKKIIIPYIIKNNNLIKTEIFNQHDIFINEYFNITPKFDIYYHNWRFNENPFYYETLVYEENNNKAVFVIRSNKNQNKKFGIIPRKVMLVDFQTTAFYDVFVNNAIDYLIDFYKNKASYISTFFNLHSMRGKILSKYFYSKTKLEPRILCIKPINFNRKEILLNSALYDLMPHVVDYY